MSGASRLLLFLFLLASGPALGDVWSGPELAVEEGFGVPEGGDLLLRADARGRVLLSVPAVAAALETQPVVELDFVGRLPLFVELRWRTSANPARLYRHGIPVRNLFPDGQVIVDMSQHEDWRGQAQLLQLSIPVQFGETFSIHRIAIRAPGVQDSLREIWKRWTGFDDWRAYDINRYTGTPGIDQGPFPVTVFAACFGAGLLVYVVLARRRVRLGVIACMFLATWVALDGLWQWRLWRHVALDREQFAGKSSAEKMYATPDSPYVWLGQRSRELISARDARVFVIGDSDAGSMLATYYLAPLNTFWDRHRIAPSPVDYLRPHDFVLLLASSSVTYDRDANQLSFDGGGTVAVRERFAMRDGTLLEVR